MKHLLCISIALTSTIALAQITPSGGGYLFRTKYKKGSTLKYRLTSTAEIPGNDAYRTTIESPVSMFVSNASSGKYEITMKMGPNKQDGKVVGGVSSRTATVNSRGGVVQSNAKQGNTLNLFDVIFPEKSVKVGSSWISKDSGSLQNVGIVQTTTKYTFKGIKTIAGVKVAELTLDLSGGQRESTAVGSGYIYLRVDDGTYHGWNMRFQAKPNAGGGAGQRDFVVTSSIRLVRLYP